MIIFLYFRLQFRYLLTNHETVRAGRYYEYINRAWRLLRGNFCSVKESDFKEIGLNIGQRKKCILAAEHIKNHGLNG